jgi:hypothetical protein
MQRKIKEKDKTMGKNWIYSLEEYTNKKQATEQQEGPNTEQLSREY